MNGRALNEKAIEVSPSSSRVLDRAQDILTPFPPSKNRPRPGDWTCPSCGFSNFQRRTACFRCSFSPIGGHGDGINYGGGGPGYGYGAPPMMGPPQHVNHHNSMGHGGRVPFRAGDWKCGNDACQYHNFAKNVCCLRCGASRAGAAIVADSGFTSPMDPPSNYGIGQGGMGNNAGPGGFPSAAGGFGSQGGYGQHFGGPPSTYALPSGLGAGAGSHYQPMNSHFGPGPGAHHAGAFDSRAAEVAFQSAGNGPAGAAAGSNNFYGQAENDPFAFLSSGMGGLTVSGDARQNGNAAPNKSPAA